MITNKINFLQARRAKINIQLLELQQKHNDLLEEKKKIAMDILDAGVLENLNILNAKIEELSKEQGEIEQSLKIWKENEDNIKRVIGLLTVYQEMTDLVKKQLYDLLTKIESIGDTGSKECIKICKEIKDLICRQIQVCVSSDDKLSAYSGRYREIGHGSTSYCYSLVDDDSSSVLVKEFHPTRYAKEDISLCDSNGCASIPQCGLYWIADSARDDVDKVKSFLTDFARFIKQETRIVSIIKDSHKSGSDSFFNPKLYISSVGLIYLDTALCGKMLNDAIGGIDEKGYSLSAIIDRFEMILRIAQSVAVYHDNGYFNGDLKPSNLFQIEAEGKQKIIRNIDFDTCVNVEKDIKDKSYFEKDIRTTRIFYSPTGIRLLGMDINEKDDETLKQARNFLLKFDVSAIANILIFYKDLLCNGN